MPGAQKFLLGPRVPRRFLDPDNGASRWFAITREGAALNLEQIDDVAHRVERLFPARTPDYRVTIFDG